MKDEGPSQFLINGIMLAQTGLPFFGGECQYVPCMDAIFGTESANDSAIEEGMDA